MLLLFLFYINKTAAAGFWPAAGDGRTRMGLVGRNEDAILGFHALI